MAAAQQGSFVDDFAQFEIGDEGFEVILILSTSFIYFRYLLEIFFLVG